MKRVHHPLLVLTQHLHTDQEVQTELNLTETQIWTCLKSHFVVCQYIQSLRKLDRDLKARLQRNNVFQATLTK